MRGTGRGGNPGGAPVGSGYFPLTRRARRAAARQELLGVVRGPRQVRGGGFGLRRFGDTRRGAWLPGCGSHLQLLSAPTRMGKLRAWSCWSGSPRVPTASMCVQGSEGGPRLDDRRWPGLEENRGWLEPGDTGWWLGPGGERVARVRDRGEEGVEGMLDGWGTEDWGQCEWNRGHARARGSHRTKLQVSAPQSRPARFRAVPGAPGAGAGPQPL